MSAKLLIEVDLATLRRAVEIKEQIETLTQQLHSVLTTGDRDPVDPAPARKRKYKMSAASRANMAAAQRLRWAKLDGRA